MEDALKLITLTSHYIPICYVLFTELLELSGQIRTNNTSLVQTKAVHGEIRYFWTKIHP